jgi:AcrR family transcriptional regulator
MTSREAMIDSAIVLFRRQGVADTSMRDIVEHSGAPRGSLYHHFPGGKDQLAGEATARAGVIIASLLDGLAGQEPGEAVASFVGYWRRALTSADFADGCPAAAAALSSEPSARKAAGEAFTTWETSLAAALTSRGRTSGQAAGLATLVVASVEGALILARAQGTDEPLRQVGQQLGALLA